MPSILLKEKLECKHCGKSFIPKRRNAAYCSPDCANRIRLPDLVADTVECQGCGQVFVRQRRDQRFCSSNCRQLYNLENLETLHIPKTVFEGTRAERVAKLEAWLDNKGYLLD